jgi:hypothetical protein
MKMESDFGITSSFLPKKKKKSLRFALEQATKRYSSTLSATSELDGVGDQRHALAALPPGMTRTYFTEGWVGPRAGLNGYRKSRCHRDSISGPPST